MQEFVRVLRFMNKGVSRSPVQQAIEQALAYGCPHLDGVLVLTAHRGSACWTSPALADPVPLPAIGSQPIDLQQYERLLGSCS